VNNSTRPDDDAPHGPALELGPVYKRQAAMSALLVLLDGPHRWTDLAAAIREGAGTHFPDSTLNRAFAYLEGDLGLITSEPVYSLTPEGRRLARKFRSIMDADSG
jgi:hypothetical protein